VSQKKNFGFSFLLYVKYLNNFELAELDLAACDESENTNAKCKKQFLAKAEIIGEPSEPFLLGCEI